MYRLRIRYDIISFISISNGSQFIHLSVADVTEGLFTHCPMLHHAVESKRELNDASSCAFETSTLPHCPKQCTIITSALNTLSAKGIVCNDLCMRCCTTNCLSHKNDTAKGGLQRFRQSHLTRIDRSIITQSRGRCFYPRKMESESSQRLMPSASAEYAIPSFKLYKRRWLMLALFCLMNLVNSA